MSWIQALVLGVVQGITEFLPVSSSGHLALISLLQVSFGDFQQFQQPLVFDVVLHLGTASALIIYFWNDLIAILRGNWSLGKLILVGSIPAAALGVLLEEFIAGVFRGAMGVISFLFLGTILMIVAELKVKRDKSIPLSTSFSESTGVSNISVSKAFVIGLFQALALFSGVSRSGATLSGGMLLGLTRERAARFSFLLSIPIVLGAVIFKITTSYWELSSIGLVPILVGLISSFLVGMVVIRFLLKFLQSNSLWVFIWYRLAVVLGLASTFLYLVLKVSN